MNIKEFLDTYGTDTTNNFQLEKYAKDLKIPNFHVLMRDELETKLLQLNPLNIIINIHESNQKGAHWSLIHKNSSLKKAFFFDSYGLPPTEEVINFLKSIPDKIHSTFILQDFDDKYCGSLCLYILYRLNKNDMFQDIILEIFNYKNEHNVS